jgi:hypothetical protein
VPTKLAKKPREPVLTLNEVKGKGGVVSVRVFGNALIYPRLNAFVSRDDITAEN